MGLFDHLVDIPLAADLTREEARSLMLVFLASALGAIFSRWHLRVVLPTVVVEIVLGILIGPEGLDIAHVNDYITFLSDFGPRAALLLRRAGGDRAPHPSRCAATRNHGLGDLPRDSAWLSASPSKRPASTRRGGCWRSRSRRPRSARSSRSSRTRACCRLPSGGRCSGTASRASSGRSSSSPSS